MSFAPAQGLRPYPDRVQDSQTCMTVSAHYLVTVSSALASNRRLYEVPKAGFEEFWHGGAVRPLPAGLA